MRSIKNSDRHPNLSETQKPGKYSFYSHQTGFFASLISRWQFAYTALLETQITPKLSQFKWDCMKLIPKTRREYVRIYKNKLINGRMTTDEIENEKRCIQTLDVFNILLARRQAEVQACVLTLILCQSYLKSR
jgi:hypothetical protein